MSIVISLANGLKTLFFEDFFFLYDGAVDQVKFHLLRQLTDYPDGGKELNIMGVHVLIATIPLCSGNRMVIISGRIVYTTKAHEGQK